MIFSTPFFLACLLLAGATSAKPSIEEELPGVRRDRTTSTTGSTEMNDQEYKKGRKRLIVQYHHGQRNDLKKDMEDHPSKNKMKVLHEFEGLDAFVVDGDEEVEEIMRGNGKVAMIMEDTPRYIVSGTLQDLGSDAIDDEGARRGLVSTSEFFGGSPINLNKKQVTPYGVSMVQAPQVWDRGFRGQNVKVCVIDSGVDIEHEDFDIENVDGEEADTERQKLQNTPWYVDNNGHGTHVIGTIAAADNDIGVVGVAPEAHIFSILASSNTHWNETTMIFSSDLITTAQLCVDRGAKVINMSFGGETGNEFEYRFFLGLRQQGVLVVAASGNAGETSSRGKKKMKKDSGEAGRGKKSDPISFPAAYPHVMSCAAVNDKKVVSDWSSQNRMVDIAAPGVGILSTAPMGLWYPTYLASLGSTYQYAFQSGTSMSAPHVAGVAALLWSAKPDATVREIRTAIERTAEDIGQKGKDRSSGHGLVQALDALDFLLAN